MTIAKISLLSLTTFAFNNICVQLYYCLLFYTTYVYFVIVFLQIVGMSTVAKEFEELKDHELVLTGGYETGHGWSFIIGWVGFAITTLSACVSVILAFLHEKE